MLRASVKVEKLWIDKKKKSHLNWETGVFKRIFQFPNEREKSKLILGSSIWIVTGPASKLENCMFSPQKMRSLKISPCTFRNTATGWR